MCYFLMNPVIKSYSGCCTDRPHLEEMVGGSEKQKVKDMKTVFSEFIIIEMLFLSKASEVYTAPYQNIQKIDEKL